MTWEHAMVTVRTGSSRLPSKCMMELSESRSVLSHVLLRCIEFRFRPLVATTLEPEDDVVCDVAAMMGVPYHRGPTRDKMTRWLDASRAHGLERFVVVDCDDPFFDPDLTRTVYDLTMGADYVLPDMDAYLGSHGMGVRTSGLEASCAAKATDDTEMVWRHIHDAAEVLQVRVADASPVEQGLRLTLDYAEDYWLLRTVMRILGPSCRRRDIVSLFERNPQMRLVNEFRNAEWRSGQEATP